MSSVEPKSQCERCDFLASEVMRQRDKIAALRADRNIWRQMCIELFGVVRTLRDVILGK